MDCICLVESWWNRAFKKNVHKITDERKICALYHRAGWRWTGTAPAGQCLLFVGQNARECESCTWNRRFCTERDDAFCPDRSSCNPSSEDCGESWPTDSHVSGIVHVARQGETRRGKQTFQSLRILTHRFIRKRLSFLERDELVVRLERSIASSSMSYFNWVF